MKHLTFILSLGVLSLAVEATAQEKLTEAVCEADRNAMFEEAERNRIQAIGQLEFELRRTTDETTAEFLNDQINQAWEDEEMYRNTASVMFRDCVRYVKSQEGS